MDEAEHISLCKTLSLECGLHQLRIEQLETELEETQLALVAERNDNERLRGELKLFEKLKKWHRDGWRGFAAALKGKQDE